ncbi:MAG: hypothetical protein SWO11_16355 [Thermodesulfobacteriota bacterium]|nr:hypothetical protein [Thermodesulfobacteriota bacterium]
MDGGYHIHLDPGRLVISGSGYGPFSGQIIDWTMDKQIKTQLVIEHWRWPTGDENLLLASCTILIGGASMLAKGTKTA